MKIINLCSACYPLPCAYFCSCSKSSFPTCLILAQEEKGRGSEIDFLVKDVSRKLPLDLVSMNPPPKMVESHWNHMWREVKLTQSCPTLCDPMHYIVHGIFQAWVASPFSRGSFQPRDQTQVSRIAGGFFTSWATREAVSICNSL